MIPQNALVGMANTDFGRDLLGIDKSLPKVVQVTKDGYTCHLGGSQLLSRFESGPAPIARRLKKYESQFASYLRYFEQRHNVSPLATRALAMTCTVDNFTASTDDRGITSNGSGNTWAQVRAGVGLALETLARTTNFSLSFKSGSDFFIYRPFMYFATGATIPSGNTISAASLDLTYAGTAQRNHTMYLVKNRQATTSLATTDWDLIGTSGVGTGTTFGSYTRPNGEGAATKTITINATGQADIAKGSGNTFFAVIHGDDWDNIEPTAALTGGTDFNTADNAGAKPTLSVTHTASSARLLLLLGVGT